MIFALLFFLSFVVGWLIYFFSSRWLIAVGLPLALFILGSFGGGLALSNLGMSLAFGIPIVFLGALFGAYIVQIRRFDESELDGADDD